MDRADSQFPDNLTLTTRKWRTLINHRDKVNAPRLLPRPKIRLRNYSALGYERSRALQKKSAGYLTGNYRVGFDADLLSDLKQRSNHLLAAQQMTEIVSNKPYRTLNAWARINLSRLLNLHLPNTRIYTDADADQVARNVDADAVNYGDALLFRSRQYDPNSKRGLALIGHELTHAALARARAYQGRPDLEERLAQKNESYVRSVLPLKPSPLHTPSQEVHAKPIPAPARDLASVPALRTAPSGRDVHMNPSESSVSSSIPLSEGQLNRIKDEVYRDLKNRLRIDFERGG